MTKLLEISDWTVTILSLLNIYIIPFFILSSDKIIFFLQLGYSVVTILLYWIVRSRLKSNIDNLVTKKRDYQNLDIKKIVGQKLEKIKQEKEKFFSNFNTEYDKSESNMKAFNISMLSLTALPYLLSVIMKLYIKFGNKKQK